MFAEYYDDGAKESGGSYRGDKRFGVFRQWYPNGTLAEVSHWRSGLLDGELISYDQRGKIERRQNYRDGKPTK